MKMRLRARLCLFLGLAAVCGCSRQQTADCEPTERYSTARSVAPVQIPDDLSPPDETDALRLPPVVPAPRDGSSEACLEVPPSFFAGGRPGSTGRENDDAAAGREGDAEANTPTDDSAPETDSERVIEN